MFRHTLTILVSVATSPLLLSGGQCVQSAPIASNSMTEAKRWAWVKAPWTASDKPFITIHQRIDDAIAKGQLPYEQAAIYKARALKDPNNAQSQFAWGYSAWQAYRGDRKSSVTNVKRQQVIMGVPGALERVPEPHSAEFARMRFLLLGVAQSGAPANRRLREVGDRLLIRYPNDITIKAYQVGVIVYTSQMKPTDKSEALKLINQVIEAQPQKPSVYSTLGGIYFVSWMKSQSQADAQNAIAAYRKYLALAPKDDAFRPRAESIIKQLQGG